MVNSMHSSEEMAPTKTYAKAGEENSPRSSSDKKSLPKGGGAR